MRQPSFTCPLIDRTIAEARELYEADQGSSIADACLKNILSNLEDIRDANLKLREYGNYYEDKCCAAETDAESARGALADARDRIMVLEDRIDEFENAD